MSMKIKTEKIVVRGEQRREIKSYSLLKKSELPLDYFDRSEGYCYLDDDSELAVRWKGSGIKFYRGEKGARMGMHLREADFQELLTEILRCGNRLQKINAKLAKENADWHGEETFVI